LTKELSKRPDDDLSSISGWTQSMPTDAMLEDLHETHLA
jgi:hypothetical protein